jgi:hypothetical protein
MQSENTSEIDVKAKLGRSFDMRYDYNTHFGAAKELTQGQRNL